MESAASKIAIIQLAANAAESTLALRNRVAHHKGRDRVLASLYGVLENLYNNVKALEQSIVLEASAMMILGGPVSRCYILCQEFERAVQDFEMESTTGLRDWSKMEFTTGDINGFIDLLTGYQATISIVLDTGNNSVQNH